MMTDRSFWYFLRTAVLFGAAVFFALPAAASQRIVWEARTGRIVASPGPQTLAAVRITDQSGRSCPGMPVIFTAACSEGPGTVSGARWFSQQVRTDSAGRAAFRYDLQGGAGTWMVTACVTGLPASVLGVRVESRYWQLLTVLWIAAGLGIFIFGMVLLNDALQKTAGPRFRSALVSAAGSPLRGLLTGFGVTLLNQSSTATTVLEVSLVSAGIMSFTQSLAITMGAEIGSTITAQLVAFRLSDFALPVVALGGILRVVSSRRAWRHTGEAIAGFGLLFFGMKLMADTMTPLAAGGEALALVHQYSDPLAALLGGLVLTLIVHSSGATAGIVMALALAGVISLNQAVAVNLGAQIGTCVTAWLAAIGRGREGRRVALWHVVHQSAGAGMVYGILVWTLPGGESAWLWFVRRVTEGLFFSVDAARQIAMAHTLAALLNAAVFLPLLPFVDRLLRAVYPARPGDMPFGPAYLDPVLLESPELALEAARKEIVREAGIVRDMLKGALAVFESRSRTALDDLALQDTRVDALYRAIVPYLAAAGQNAAGESSRQQLRLLSSAADCEEIGDCVDRDILPLARKYIDGGLRFSDEGWAEIRMLGIRVSGALDGVIQCLEGVPGSGEAVFHARGEVEALESDLRRSHINRLTSGLRESLETSSIHMDLIAQLKRVNAHAADLAGTMAGLRGENDSNQYRHDN